MKFFHDRIYLFALLLLALTSCQNRRGDIELTDFTKDLVNLYWNDEMKAHYGKFNKPAEIIIMAYTDSSNFWMEIFWDDNMFCYDDYLGKTRCSGHPVKVFGDEDSMFYTVRTKAEHQKCTDAYLEFDPLVWSIVFNKDKSIDKIRTHSNYPNQDISGVLSLAEKYYPVSHTERQNKF